MSCVFVCRSICSNLQDIFPRGKHSLPHQVEIGCRNREEIIALNFVGLNSSFSSLSIEALSDMRTEKNAERGWLVGISSLKEGFEDFKIHIQRVMMRYVVDSSRTTNFPSILNMFYTRLLVRIHK